MEHLRIPGIVGIIQSMMTISDEKVATQKAVMEDQLILDSIHKNQVNYFRNYYLQHNLFRSAIYN
jgi:hypothetical protein